MAERVATHRDHPESCGRLGETLIYRRPDPGPITIMTQPVEAFIAEALDAVPVDALPKFCAEGLVEGLGTEIASGLSQCGFAPTWLAEWLLGNVLFQARLFTELTQARRVRLRLEKVLSDDACPDFHVDRVRQRLLCTYRGPGTEWVDPRFVSRQRECSSIQDLAIRRLERGAIALVRGSLSAAVDRPGLLHRSPQLRTGDLVRLLLVIDEADPGP